MEQGINGYYVDVVMCIDATGGMIPLINEIKNNALSFFRRLADAMAVNYAGVTQLRVKVIFFRDYGYDDEPMNESDFFVLPDQNNELYSFINSIYASGGADCPENALEAIALALKSDWTTDGYKRRHIIIVFSDAPALELGTRSNSPLYPEGLPSSLKELTGWWEGTEPSFLGSYQPKAGRLVAFVPMGYPWFDMQVWNRAWFAFCESGTGLPDVDIQSVINLVASTI